MTRPRTGPTRTTPTPATGPVTHHGPATDPATGRPRPRLLLIMGQGASGRTWTLHQVPAFVDAGYEVLTYDHRAAGTVDRGPFTFGELVDDAADIIRRTGDGPAAVVGTSLGARIAGSLTARHPGLVTRCVMAAAHAAAPRTAQVLSARGDRAAALLAREEPEYLDALTAARNLSPATLADPAREREWLDVIALSRHLSARGGDGRGTTARRGPAGATAAGDGGAATDRPGTPPTTPSDHADPDRPWDLHAEYATIGRPCLALAYGDDRVVTPAQVRYVAATVPGATYREVPRTGHWGYLERPDEVNRVILEFLAGR
ncbi:alpha/beta fold hydrolase [Corynebacterium bovis]|uniref:alpha/beta fold hydrolase n=2 Tax=Corynebacterium bovis TaxID=36808 RepID=UPI000F64FE78|nr:alpha/beta hydrolase [Corynebacterium bovis]RRO82240.1 alpha/beta hydrolase [Corynebacterium bovis]